MKHTKGEWKVKYLDDLAFVEAEEPKSSIGKIEILMEDFGEHTGYPKEQRDADAKLIAAAPQMLDACKYACALIESLPEHLSEQISDYLGDSIDYARIEAAINKATK